jgi:hypothetical protein
MNVAPDSLDAVFGASQRATSMAGAVDAQGRVDVAATHNGTIHRWCGELLFRRGSLSFRCPASGNPKLAPSMADAAS